MTEGQHGAIDDLLARSHRLGADRSVTNYGGGNTSAKVHVTDPVTGADTRVLYVKGSGGDLATLARSGLAALDLDRLHAAARRYRPGTPDGEDEFVGLIDLCTFCGGGAAPSIDTSMHALLEVDHVDHLHPDSVISLAAAAEGEALVKECFDGDVGWVPWRRPGIDLALEVAALTQANPKLRGVVLGGHGLTAWGTSSEACEATSLAIIRRAAEFIAATGRAEPFGAVVAERRARDRAARRAAAAALAPVVRGLCSTDHHRIVTFDDSDAVLDFLARESLHRLAALGTSCPDHFLRTKVRPLVLDLPADADFDRQATRLEELHRLYREDYAAYYERYATPESPAMRGADPAIVLVPGIGMFSAGDDVQTATVAGEFYRNAIEVMRGAEAVSTYAPIPEAEKFRVEYWSLEEAKLARRPPRPRLAGRVALVTGAGSGIGRATAERLAGAGACVVVSDRDAASATDTMERIGAPLSHAVALDVRDSPAVRAAVAEACLRYGGIDVVVNNAGLSISAELARTTEDDWQLQHDVMSMGSFLVSRAAADVMARQGLGGDIVYIVSKNSVVAGPSNIAYGSAKAAQAHQVRLLAAELGAIGVRVNGVNPDGVVQGSGIFASGWGAQRAAVYDVPEEELGAYYASRTLLKQEVLPRHVADAVFALVSGDLSLTTGTHVPVDGGVPAAFLR
ncbi:MAG TPA: bifunctional rhamnulose-1-phosphate aldolase/short-chain dehydrogenase [Acidimicrobiales bacterium]|nr:bifunctional rhamnulose-1-phosphate aldolase/short-chain dehydrogenase [Acidimicrobiales bacterium]